MMTEPCDVQRVGDVTVLRLHDPEMMKFENIPQTMELLHRFFEESATPKTLINFEEIEFYNSMALGILATLRKKAGDYGKTVSLCQLNHRTMWSIQAMRLHEILDIYYSEEQALAALNAASPGTTSPEA